jgi:3-hydroxybutyryl-CoA dehydrogenase
VSERIGIAGGGAIASGLACVAAEHGQVVVWARRPDAATARVEKLIERRGGVGAGNVAVSDDLEALRDATFVVEAIAEEHGAKAALLRDLGSSATNGTILATTTSALSVTALADATGRPGRFVGLHVFNPVPKMDLVELVFPAAASQSTRERSFALCQQLGKTAVEVPDLPGFVVNRLLFPFLFEAVRLREETGLEPAAVDSWLQLGAGHPMGPLALLDLVGLDVAQSIGRTIGADVPERIDALVAEGALGRKSGRGFYTY